MQTLNKIIEITRPYWPRVFLGIVLGLLVSAVTGAIAWLVKPALDIVFVDKKYEYLKLIPVGVFTLFMLKGLMQFGQEYLMRSAGMKLVRDTQDKLHHHILYIPVGYFHREASGVVMSRVINDVRLLNALFSDVLKSVIIAIPTIVVLLWIALYRKWDLTLLSIMLVPLIAFSTKKYGKKVKKRSLEIQRKISFLTQRLSETITGAKMIKVFTREDYRDRKFIEENRRVYRENVRVIKLKESAKLLIDVVTGTAIGLVLWYGGNQVRNGAITSGDFASIITAIYMIFSPVKKLGESYTFLQEIRSAIERIETVLQTPTEKGGSREIRDILKGIRFEDVSFTYASNDIPVLKNINLAIGAGEVLAVVGPSGAGKTTFADLIPRFYDPTSGRITIDEIDIREAGLRSLRDLIGIVSQDIILFDDTVAENISFGRPGAQSEDIRKAAEMAYAAEFIEKLPEGYDTFIGERGMKLSGGQRQRIAIARAVLKNPPLLILDEATSSLDTVSESLVQRALEGLMKNRTTIIIAHRLSTIKNADRIVVLEDGRITDMGTHDELLSRGTTYARLCSEMML
jgi:subfamily B ATP-binding cassette protein MsbA